MTINDGKGESNMEGTEINVLNQDTMKAIIAANIAELRKMNGMTQQDLAAKPVMLANALSAFNKSFKFTLIVCCK